MQFLHRLPWRQNFFHLADFVQEPCCLPCHQAAILSIAIKYSLAQTAQQRPSSICQFRPFPGGHTHGPAWFFSTRMGVPLIRPVTMVSLSRAFSRASFCSFLWIGHLMLATTGADLHTAGPSASAGANPRPVRNAAWCDRHVNSIHDLRNQGHRGPRPRGCRLVPRQ